MNSREFNKHLSGVKVGGYWGRGNMLFDREYIFIEYQEAVNACKWVAKELGWFEYNPNRSDCDNYAILWSGKMMEWFARNTIYNETPTFGMLWGNYNGESHMWNFFMTGPKELYHVNYGVISTPRSWSADGSIVA